MLPTARQVASKRRVYAPDLQVIAEFALRHPEKAASLVLQAPTVDPRRDRCAGKLPGCGEHRT